jgi:ferredoxin--NADP+ reductase
MRAVNQDPQEFRAMLEAAVQKAQPTGRSSCFSLRFLCSPVRINANASCIASLQVEENTMILGEDGEARARGTGQTSALDVDTVIFAIGDVVDSALGLPMQSGEFARNPQPRFPIETASYEAFDPCSGQVIPDVFLAGWARRPSTGLVGMARKDATNAAEAVSEYLQTIAPTCQPVDEIARERLLELNHPVVDQQALRQLEAREREQARALDLETFKFATNQEMLEVLGPVTV